MRKLLKITGLSIIAIAGVIIISAIAINKRLPEPTYGPEADILAHLMLNNLNVQAWDSLAFIQWTSSDKRHYIWDKQNNIANIKWNDFEIVLDLNLIKGSAYKADSRVIGKEKEELIKKAWNLWCSDSFWLCAPYKIFDKGTKRGIIEQKDGSHSLMVSFMEGGTTPGDSYLWELDENYIPTSWKMWVQKLPIGGVDSSWEGWVELPGGAKISTSHQSPFIKQKISNVKASQNLIDLDLDSKVFSFL